MNSGKEDETHLSQEAIQLALESRSKFVLEAFQFLGQSACSPHSYSLNVAALQISMEVAHWKYQSCSQCAQ